LTAAAIVICITGVHAQSYPSKPIRIITTDPAGAADIAARLIAPTLTSNLGQQVIIDNRPGAGSMTSIENVAKAVPDGHTLLLHGSPVWLMQFMRSNLPWDPLRDLAPVSLATTLPNVLTVHPSLPVRSVKDLIALARARPGDLNYGAGSAGASNHLAAELFNTMAKVSMVRIAYKGGGPAVLGLIGGQTQLMFATAASVKPHIDSGRLRAVAVTTANPSELFPKLPTVAASGLPGYEALTLYGLFAPAKTTVAVVNLLNKEMVAALARPEVKERLARSGAEATSSTPEAFGAIVRDDITRWGKVIKEAGIRAE
jgi:tripartite-type tricarboxylate transporter receptor subunit TctC